MSPSERARSVIDPRLQKWLAVARGSDGRREIRAAAAAIDASLSHPHPEEEGDVLASLLLVVFSGAHKLLYYSLSVCQSVLQQLLRILRLATTSERANLNKRSPEGDRCSCLVRAGVRLVV
jgi:hypothetical protein